MKLCDACFDAVMQRAKELEDATEKALKAAKRAKVEGAINWGDLHCVEASINVAAHEGLCGRVLIEEAAPDNRDLREYVYQYLTRKGFRDVEVTTEW
jgi:glutamyl-tRNA reductase